MSYSKYVSQLSMSSPHGMVDKSPISQSIRNLFSVLKKGAAKKDDTRSLFYLSTISGWESCTAVLHRDPPKLVLSTMQLVTHEIILAGCVDVRSSHLDHPPDLSPFEIKFPGRNAKEIFAAHSAKDRAAWISSIWDAVLPNVPPTETSPLLRSQRSLPPVPSTPLKKPNLHLNIPPLSPSIYSLATPSSSRPPSLSASTYPATSHPGSASPSPSPSIMTLTQRSMVQRRLAQIEKSKSSASGLSRPGTPITPIRSRTLTMTPRPSAKVVDRIESGDPTIHQVLLEIDARLINDAKSLTCLKEKVDNIGDQLSAIVDLKSELPSTIILEKLEEITVALDNEGIGKQIQNRLEEDAHKQALLSQQQADSVRYLNELNNASSPLLIIPI